MARLTIDQTIKKLPGFDQTDFMNTLKTAIDEEGGNLEECSEVVPNTYRFVISYHSAYQLILGCFSPTEYDKVEYINSNIISTT